MVHRISIIPNANQDLTAAAGAFPIANREIELSRRAARDPWREPAVAWGPHRERSRYEAVTAQQMALGRMALKWRPMPSRRRISGSWRGTRALGVDVTNRPLDCNPLPPLQILAVLRGIDDPFELCDGLIMTTVFFLFRRESHGSVPVLAILLVPLAIHRNLRGRHCGRDREMDRRPSRKRRSYRHGAKNKRHEAAKDGEQGRAACGNAIHGTRKSKVSSNLLQPFLTVKVPGITPFLTFRTAMPNK
ncbi:hypothetical protein LZC95_28515 [Pendulispora brunnea]|uniref:Uncharacterized protein n=1 Tax=Pendulispora brunnea TaxID=2905690 RepID=A0ABZ2JXA5_9BACT